MTDLTKAQSFVNKLEIVHMQPDELAHHGVIGMKWGVRKDKGHEGERAKTKKIVKLDKKFESNAQTPKLTFALNNAAAKKANELDVDRINNKPQYKNADFTRDTPLRRKYYKEHQDAFLDRLQEVADSYGTNASGTAKYSILETPDGGWDVFLKEVKHADEDEPVFKVNVTYNKSGHITNLTLDELAHYGVLGMKWGRRKDQGNSAVTSSKEPRKVKFKNSATGETTRRKYPRKASNDHVESRELLRKKRPELTNQDIQKIVDRLQKEKKLKDIKPGAINRGKKITIGVLATLGTATTLYNFMNSPLGKQSIKKGAIVVNAVLKKVR